MGRRRSDTGVAGEGTKMILSRSRPTVGDEEPKCQNQGTVASIEQR